MKEITNVSPNEDTQLEELKLKVQTKKRVKKKRASKIEENELSTTETERTTNKVVGLAAELDSLKEDVVTVTTPRKPEIKQDIVVSEARKIPLAIKQRDDSMDAGERREIENIYIEKHLGFRAEPIKQFEKRLAEKQKSLQRTALHQTLWEQTNPGLSFALAVHGVIDRFGRTALGIFAGASLVHTLFIQSFAVPRRVQTNGLIQSEKDNGLLLLLRYGLYAEPIAITYYVAFILTGLFVFERFDIGRPTTTCFLHCLSLANGGIAVLFHFVAFAISNAMRWLDYTITTMANSHETEINVVLTNQPEFTRRLDVWRILDICRTVFLLASWLAIALSSPIYDRTRKTLLSDPNVENTSDTARVRPNMHEEDGMWRSTETMKTFQ